MLIYSVGVSVDTSSSPAARARADGPSRTTTSEGRLQSHTQRVQVNARLAEGMVAEEVAAVLSATDKILSRVPTRLPASVRRRRQSRGW